MLLIEVATYIGWLHAQSFIDGRAQYASRYRSDDIRGTPSQSFLRLRPLRTLQRCIHNGHHSELDEHTPPRRFTRSGGAEKYVHLRR